MEDRRNREKWERYQEGAEEMLVKTSTRTAPRNLVEGNDKYWARVRILTRPVEALSKDLNYARPTP